eukprot:COSAG04_NODE_23884_length_330_cov_1.259740_1_plen_76_part_10
MSLSGVGLVVLDSPALRELVLSSLSAVMVRAGAADAQPRGDARPGVNNLVSSATQADGINLHGYVRDALVQNTHIS